MTSGEDGDESERNKRAPINISEITKNVTVLRDVHPQESAFTIGKISVVNPATVRNTSSGLKATFESAFSTCFDPYLYNRYPTKRPNGI